MTVLTQDTAREFLGNSSVSEKYKLFMKGVQLSQLDFDYSLVEGEISTMQNTISRKEESLKDLELKEKDAKDTLRVFQRSAALEEKVNLLRNHFVWAQVKDQEAVFTAEDFLMKGCCGE